MDTRIIGKGQRYRCGHPFKANEYYNADYATYYALEAHKRLCFECRGASLYPVAPVIFPLWHGQPVWTFWR